MPTGRGDTLRNDRTRLRIHADDTIVEVDPGLGAGVLAFRVSGHDVLRPCPGTPDDPRLQSMFVMSPWVNRIDGGRFFAGDRFVSLRPNLAGEPHPIHGQAWQAPWEVTEHADDRMTARFQGGSDDWPWPYTIEHHLAVEPGRLDCRLSLVNRGDSPMPAGIGFHPYFERPARLTATVDGAFESGADGLPRRWEPRAPFRSTDIDGITTDDSYTGWDGRAVVELPSVRVDMSSSCDLLHIYSPRGRSFFCAEPVSAAPDAVNHDERGLRTVDPGAALSVTLRLTVRLR